MLILFSSCPAELGVFIASPAEGHAQGGDRRNGEEHGQLETVARATAKQVAVEAS